VRPEPKQARQAQHLAAAQLDVQRLQRAAACDAFGAQHGCAGRGVAGRGAFAVLHRADHLVDQGRAAQLGRQVLALGLAIAQHRDAVGDRVGLL
jgi:hypothetical protein